MSAAAPAPLDRRRLALVLGLLGSPYDGEATAAARRAAAIVRAAGVSWQDLLDPPVPNLPRFPAPPLDADAIIAAALARPGRLSDWEFNFVSSLAECRPLRLSERQADALARIARKIGVRGWP